MIANVNILESLNEYITKGARLLDFLYVTDLRKHIGSRIKLFRDRADLSQEAIAKALKISKATVFRLESGESWGEYTTLSAIATHLGVSVEDFFAGMDHLPIKPTPEEALEVLREALEKPTPKAKEESYILPEDILNLWSKLNDIGREKARAQLSSLASIPDNCLKLGKKKNSIG